MSILNRLLGRPSQEPVEKGPLYAVVQGVLGDVQAYARSHGGEIQLVGVNDEGDVKIRLTGACKGCPMSTMTVKHGIEAQLKQLVPGVRNVIQVG